MPIIYCFDYTVIKVYYNGFANTRLVIKREAAMRIVKLTEKEKNNILENLLKRSPNQYSKFEDTVNDIIENVRANKDKALFEYTEKFDGVKITEETFKVTDEEIEEAYTKVDVRLIENNKKSSCKYQGLHQKRSLRCLIARLTEHFSDRR